MKMRLLWLWPAIIILCALAACIVTYVIPDAQIRAVTVMSFLFICPGMALVRFLRLNDVITEWIMAFSLSFAIDAIVGGIFLYTGHWSLSGILITLLVISLLGATGQLVILHPVVAQRLSALSIFKMPEDITDSETMALPKISLAGHTGKAVSIEDQQTAYLSNYKLSSSTDQTRDVTETDTIQMPSVIRNTPAQEDIADHDTTYINAVEHINANDLPDIIDESQNNIEAIEEKATVHVPSISISYSPAPQAKPNTDKQSLEEQETQQLSTNTTQEQDLLEEQDITPIPEASPSSADNEQVIDEQDIAPIPEISSSSADDEQAVEEKETINIPSVQMPEPDLIPEQTSVNPLTSEKEQEEQEEKEPVIIAAKPEPFKEPQKKEKTLSARTIIPHTNPHKAIVQEPTTKNVLRKKRLTKEALKREVSEQDNI
ncbi:hypothetical protein KSC_095070 [Ktedonobacter sp. SOSP1-52]|uniref:hypothetical protein n=1 Tax=Ktedonobacter sp. SOSP1-52 TaxID=2778366 RepID=UPI001915E77F|nr:hypothetical protein [Ktedonobacter sp. SOSP1-52]GHO70615.1 hypothetical protein KSC_095070 [Ktedonobacter sp. SOSP1-52]